MAEEEGERLMTSDYIGNVEVIEMIGVLGIVMNNK